MPQTDIGVIESSGKGIGSFGADIYFGNPMAEAEARILRERTSVVEDDYVIAEYGPVVIDRPRPIEAGPMTFTTCQAMEIWPTIVWDVNGYYRDLGCNPKATKREIRRAYQNNGGADSERKTYIIKQLLDDAIRRRYDACPMGSIFFDKYVAQQVKEQMLIDQMQVEGRILSFDDRIEDMELVDLSQFVGRTWDEAAGEWFEETATPDFSLEGDHYRWRYGYYLWQVDDYDTDRLRRWQKALLQAAASQQEVVEISIGLVGGREERPVRVKRIGYRCVVFLGHSQEPTAALAETAMRRVNQLIEQETN